MEFSCFFSFFLKKSTQFKKNHSSTSMFEKNHRCTYRPGIFDATSEYFMSVIRQGQTVQISPKNMLSSLHVRPNHDFSVSVFLSAEKVPFISAERHEASHRNLRCFQALLLFRLTHQADMPSLHLPSLLFAVHRSIWNTLYVDISYQNCIPQQRLLPMSRVIQRAISSR